MIRIVVCAACALLAICTTGCRPSEDDCSRLLEHFLDVEANASLEGRLRDVPQPVTDALRDEKARFRAAQGSVFINKCRADLSRSEVACALDAPDQASMDRCEGR